MNFLIWFGFCFALALVQALLHMCDISLGAIPTMVLYFILWIPANSLSKAWNIKRYMKKFPNNFVADINNTIDFYKKEFLIKKNFHIQDAGIGFFDVIKSKVANMSDTEIEKTMIEIVKSYSSPTKYLLDLLETESLKEVHKGDVAEIINHTGSTYTVSKIYEYVMDVKLEKEILTPIQHKNRIAHIEYICNENTKKD